MPTYEYECEKTGHRFEVFQGMSGKPIRRSPECGGGARRLIGTRRAVSSRDVGSTQRTGAPGPRTGLHPAAAEPIAAGMRRATLDPATLRATGHARPA